jgi:hypothetical protein
MSRKINGYIGIICLIPKFKELFRETAVRATGIAISTIYSGFNFFFFTKYAVPNINEKAVKKTKGKGSLMANAVGKYAIRPFFEKSPMKNDL